MNFTLAFDVYGTLINTHGVVSELQTMIGEQAVDFSNKWREKQLEYSFRRGLMQNYENFGVCTSNALDYACDFFKVTLSSEQKQKLLASYKTLPAFDDVKDSLADLEAKGCRLFAFSNGAADAVDNLLEAAGIKGYFQDIVSADDLKSFKPNPAVYSHFLRKSNSTGSQAWLISSNPFDVLGAISSGMRAAWVKRSEDALFDPWGTDPTLTIKSLRELSEKLPAFEQ